MNSDQTQPPEPTVSDLASRLARIEERLAALEGVPQGTSEAPEVSEPSVAARPAEVEPPTEVDIVAWGEMVPFFGRILMVLAGAFLFRALTEMQVLPPLAGAVLGLVYALVWLVFADRAAASGKTTSATFHGIAALLIAYPLLVEVTVKFGLFSPMAAAGIWVVVTAAGLTVAARHRLRGIAWGYMLVAAVACIGLSATTGHMVLFVACLLLLGFATLWIDLSLGWRAFAWTSAWITDGMVLLVTLIALMADAERVERLLSPGSLVMLQLALCFLYLGSFAFRTRTRHSGVTNGEIVQGVLVLAIGLGGAIVVTQAYAMSGIPVGLVALALAAGCYAASFSVVDTSDRRNFIFYSSLALAFTVAGCDALFHRGGMGFAFSVAALVATALGARHQRATLSGHGAAYTLAGAVASGVLLGALRAMVIESPQGLGWVTLSGIVVLVVAVVYCAIPIAEHGRTWGKFSLAPKMLVLAVLVIGLNGIVVAAAAPLLPVDDSGLPMAGGLAALRTATLAISALVLGLLRRRAHLRAAGWLVYPLLIVGGLKLVAEDLRAGQATTMFISLGIYGAALILAPRLIRRKPTPSSS